jgi:hypothetical protein
LKRFLLAGSALTAIFLAACLVAPTEPGPGGAPGCSPGERSFNGACRQECTANGNCDPGLRCMDVGGSSSLCLDYAQCGYLGSDSVCGERSGYGGSPYPDVTMPYGVNDCAGDARWLQSPPSAAGAACGVEHSVTRCTRRGSRCELVPTTTRDVAAP